MIRIGLGLALLATIALALKVGPSSSGGSATTDGDGFSIVGSDVGDDGKLESVDATLAARCGDGTSLELPWRVKASEVGASGSLRQRGTEDLDGGTEARVEYRIELDEQRTGGRIGFSASLVRSDGSKAVCRTGPVPFNSIRK